MKKKIAYIPITAAVGMAAFFIGRNTIEPETVTVKAAIDSQTYSEVAANIVDWNTDGEKLVILTADGYEVKACKTAVVYDEIRDYIPMKDIVDFTTSEEGLQIYTSDGNGYWWER